MPGKPHDSRGHRHGAKGSDGKKQFTEKQISRHKKMLEQEQQLIAELERRIQEEAPARGAILSGKTRFEELPLSAHTLKGESRGLDLLTFQHNTV